MSRAADSGRAGRRPSLSPAIVLFSCLFAAQAAILVLSPILSQVAAEFDVATSTAAQLRSISGLTAGVAALVLATAGRRFRLSSLLFVGLALIAAGSLASALAQSFTVLIAAQGVIGLGLAAVLSGGMAASEAWAGEGERVRVLSWALIGGPVAWIVGQPIVGAVAEADWRWAWVVVPFVSSVVAIGVVLMRDRAVGDDGRGCDPVGLWRLPGVASWAVGELLGFAAWGGTLVFAGAFFVERHGSSVGVTGLILGAAAAAYLPGNFLGRRWLQSGSTALPLVTFAVGAGAAVVVWGVVDLGAGFSAVALAVLAFLAAGRTIAGAALGLRVAEGRRLAAMSVRTAMLQFGYLLGSVVGGFLLDVSGYAAVAWGFGGLFLGAAVLSAGQLTKTPAPAASFRRQPSSD
jgi:DHA1 family inner membrane transport protein